MSLDLRAAAAVALLALALQACSGERTGESAEDFAARVGTGANEPAAAGQPSVPVTTPVPSDAIVSLEQLGNVAGADLGPRDGGCTFSVGGTELMLAGAPNDPATRGKAVIRTGGNLYLLDAAPGGLPAIRAGTRFTGQGVTVDVATTGSQTATLAVTDGAGRVATLSGMWVCA
jgi:hypothetical protein